MADSSVARQILSYFMRHPEATNNIEGVARRRLLDQTIHQAIEDVVPALEWLSDQGFLKKTERLGVGPLFTLNEARRGQALEFLAGQGETRRNS